MNKLKKYGRKILRHFPGLRLLVRKVYGGAKESKYRKLTEKRKVDNKLVLFETFMGRQYGCNPKAIYEYMISDNRFDDFRFVWALRETEKAENIPELQRAETVEIKSQKYFETCAQAGYIVTNSNLDNRIIKKEGQVFLQTWHGTPLKKLRCDIEAESGNANNSLEEIKYRNDVDVVRYDYFISPSAYCTEKFTSAFNLKNLNRENIIIETGYPRNDILFNYEASRPAEIRKKLGIPEDKKVIMYAPTFRDNKHDGAGYVYDTHIDFDRLRRELSDEYVILFRAHYFVANQFDFEKFRGFVYDMSYLDDITELYLITDLLITDYSSVFFDFANLKKPMIFYMYDLEEYANEIRGFYFDIDEIPGPKVKTEDELINEIRNTSLWSPDEKYRKFNEKFNYLDDGNASRRVVDIMI
ncbi:MAG: CDP-glycerol glycerophosphotransferase family protein [Eubacteriales bacterium]|nr:CDP-glycerol glycerophosphotransferase family protein [Eubacteriales bacterium]